MDERIRWQKEERSRHNRKEDNLERIKPTVPFCHLRPWQASRTGPAVPPSPEAAASSAPVVKKEYCK
jgi:hypothetical protein